MKITLISSLAIILQFYSFGQDDICSCLDKNCPDSVPEVFLPGIVSGKYLEHSSPFFESDGKTITWTTVRNNHEGHVKMKTSYENKSFTVPSLVPPILDPSLAIHFRLICNKKENKIVFGSRNPLSPEVIKNIPVDSLFMQFYNSELFKEIPYPIEYDSANNGYRITSVSKNNTLFLDKGKIYFSEYIDGVFQQPQILCGDINSRAKDWMPFVAPDESYVIFVSNREGGYGSWDLYITFKQGDNWTNPISLGDKINTGSHERCPGVSPNGRYLFFTRPDPHGNHNIWWINANIINELKK